MSIPSSVDALAGEQEPDRERIRAGEPQAGACAAPDSGQARSRTCRPLRASWRPVNTT